MKQFRNYVRMHNKSIRGWIVIWISALVFFLITSKTYEEYSKEHVFGFFVWAAALLLMTAMDSYVKKYTHFYDGDGDNLQNFIRSLSFDPGAYALLLGQQFLPVQIVSVVVIGLFGIVKILPMINVALFAGMIMTLPWIVLLWHYWTLRRAMTHAENAAFLFCRMITRAICAMIRIFLVGMAFVYFTMLLLGIFGATLLKGIDDQEVVAFYCGGGILLLAVVLLAVALSLFLTNMEGDAALFQWIKFRRLAILVLAAGLIITSVLYGYVINHNYVRLTKESVTIRSWNDDKTYYWDDVVTYRVYCKDEAIQMELSFRDGTKKNVFNGVAEITDGWFREYYSDYNYVAYVAEELLSRGVTGKLEDQKQLRKIVDGLDPECQDGFSQVESILADK